MLTLTEKETIITQELLNFKCGSDCVSFDTIDLEKVNMSLETARGVFGSIIDKGLLELNSDATEAHKSAGESNPEIWQWVVPVSDEKQEIYSDAPYKEINTVSEYLDAYNNTNARSSIW